MIKTGIVAGPVWRARATEANTPETRAPGAVSVVEWLAMIAITALSATLEFWRLDASGYGNQYYSAAVRSMAQSWRAFFFAAYDPAGFITVDKPPLGFWVQVASVKLLGFSGFSLLLPEALAGVASVIALWWVTRRSFGAVAGALAALALAITPVSVVANRDNILEPLLVLTLLLAAWALLLALERGSLGWLFVCAALVGLGFNIKMLEAYLVVPAFALAYLLCAPGRARVRVAHLALAGALMLAISLSWMAAVDAIPASQRPYVGSTKMNSELELALSYNGLGRLVDGRFVKPHPLKPHRSTLSPATQAPVAPPPGTGSPAHHGGSPARIRVGVSPVGAPGPLRLAQPPLGSEVSWLAPLALLAPLLALAPPWRKRDERDEREAPRGRGIWRDPRWRGYLLWGAWLGVCAVSFSLGRSINSYYVAVMAPAVAALAGAGAVLLWNHYRAAWRPAGGAGAWRGYALPVAVAVTGAEQAYLTQAAPGWWPWLAPALLVVSLALALALALALTARLLLRLERAPRAAAWWRVRLAPGVARGLAALALVTLLAPPLFWSGASLTSGNEGGWPAAGPQFAREQASGRPLVDAALTRYLEAHRGRATFLVATTDAFIASPLIITTGQPVMMMGGFSGHDPVLLPGSLARLVAGNKVRLFLISSANVTPAQREALFEASEGTRASRSLAETPVGPTIYTNTLTHWVSDHCTPVPPTQWSSASYAAYRLGSWALFACQ